MFLRPDRMLTVARSCLERAREQKLPESRLRSNRCSFRALPGVTRTRYPQYQLKVRALRWRSVLVSARRSRVTFGSDPDEPPLPVHDRYATDPVTDHQLRGV